MTYNDYSALDFAADEHFQQWVLTQNAEATDFWQTWIQLHPEKQSVINEARLLLEANRYEKDVWPFERMQATRERIEASLKKNKSADTAPSKVHTFRSWYSIAASVALLLSVSLGIYFFYQGEQKFTTTYGETMQLKLPDGSEVMLNANSSLRFSENWQEKGERNVWLDGEAFFKVNRHTAGNAKEAVKFIVHLEDIDVEVVGTIFNVNNRAGKVEVVLDEGIVDLKMTGGERLRMEPGDMVAYSAETQLIDKTNANLTKVKAWQNHQMILDGQPLSELAVLIKNYYGLEVDFASRQVAEKKVKATLPTDNLELVLETLELMLNVRSEKEDNRIILR
ncbi:FecR domain-containing protein [Porifericola rhodea]|uniref:FecR family protein n=1 Tax=Porifericola rhodea TaxID=930972 RepID=UPI002666C1C9|nr:FecR domain-containing protein [Porifericola rhodea]WKN32500.1 FecR domain-containing protein [Porifericola rhodea]